MKINISVLPHGADLPVPRHQTAQAAGVDLYAAIPEGKRILVSAAEVKLIPCGFCMELPAGFEAQVRPRSGLALRNNVTVLNSPGTIDSDYRGEVAVILINHGLEPFFISRGDRIAQMVVTRHETIELVQMDSLAEAARGTGGFGSTGMSS